MTADEKAVVINVSQTPLILCIQLYWLRTSCSKDRRNWSGYLQFV